MRAPSDLRRRFRSSHLLERALRHRSCGGDHNERLEYLGDALLGAVVSAELHRRYVEAREADVAAEPVGEGVLTRLRAELVSTSALAPLARELGLDQALHVAPGVGSPSDTMLAGAVEATLGALFVDSGYEAMRELTLDWLRARLDALPQNPPADAARDAKTCLKERLEKEGEPPPEYRLLSEDPRDAPRRFEVLCALSSGERASARGASRRAAEKAAAAALLRHLSMPPGP